MAFRFVIQFYNGAKATIHGDPMAMIPGVSPAVGVSMPSAMTIGIGARI